MERSKELERELIENRRYLHRHPELGIHLPQTSAYVRKQLEKMGYQVEAAGNGGLITQVGQAGDGRGKTILLRADMDALPLTEESGELFSSLNQGIAHACGHDLHTTFLLGAAKLLKEREEEISGTVKLLFQYGEETLEGAKNAIQSGVLQNPTVDAAIGIHVQPSLPLGYLNYPKGAFLSSTDTFKICIRGKGCHGGQPSMGIDPISPAAHIILALQSLQVKEVAADEPVVLNICRVESGTATNIVPDRAQLWGTLRTYDDAVCKRIKKRMREIVEWTAKSFGAEAELRFEEHCPCTVNDAELVDGLAGALIRFGSAFITEPDYRMQVSDDFGFFSQQVPSVMFIIGCKPEVEKPSHNHSPFVAYHEGVLTIGAALLAHCAYDWLEERRG